MRRQKNYIHSAAIAL